MRRNPFFGTILFNLPEEETEELPTVGVDGFKLYYNPKFWNKHNSQEQMGLLMHEAGHLFLKHVWRGKDKLEFGIDPNTGETISIYNLAGDYVINAIIRNEGMTLPQPHLYDSKYHDWTTDEVYADLCKNMPKMTKKDWQNLMNKMKDSCDKSGWGKGGKKQDDQQGKWEQIAKQAYEAAKSRGKLPAHMARMFKDMEPKEDWRNLLREYAQPFNNDYSFNPTDRRFLGEDFSLPDINDGEKIDWIAIAIDTSGSIGGKEIDTFLGEVKGIMSSYDSVRVKLTFCDADASPFIELTDYDKSKIKVTGGGGTSFFPPFELVKKEDTQPLAMLYFTDGYGDNPPAPPYDTLWLVTSGSKNSATFGKQLEFNI